MHGAAARFIWGTVVASLLLLIAWRVTVLGMAQHYTATGEFQAALAWYPDYPPALRFGVAAANDNADHTTETLELALQSNPAQARALARLARTAQRQGDRDSADKSMTLAARLAPADAELQLAVADYWLERGQVETALQHWDRVMRVRPAMGETLFPALLQLAAMPEGRVVFPRLAATKPQWWPAFFMHAAEHEVSPDTVEWLFALRRAYGAPEQRERRAYVARLLQGNQWSKAYLAWLSGLEAKARGFAGPIFDGGFETPLADHGFAWHVSDSSAVRVARRAAPGATGASALHLEFSGQVAQGYHLYQPLLLTPGHYQIAGRVWLDLTANRGLQWQVWCADAEQPLGISERLLGVDAWRPFVFTFLVPAHGCEGQTLHLVTLAERWADYKIKGEVWFDDLAATRLMAPASTTAAVGAGE